MAMSCGDKAGCDALSPEAALQQTKKQDAGAGTWVTGVAAILPTKQLSTMVPSSELAK